MPSDYSALLELSKSFRPLRTNVQSNQAGTRLWTDIANPLLDPCVVRIAGIWCEYGRVVALHMSSLGLVGPIPPVIGNFTGAFGYCCCVGILSSHFDCLCVDGAALRSLLLDNNQLSGALPCEMSALQSLVAFSASNNQLTNVDCLANCTALNNIALSNNPIQRLPPALNRLRNLVSLTVQNAALTEFPAVSGLNKLSRLWLSGNNIVGPIPMFGTLGLTALSTLVLNNLQLTNPTGSDAYLDSLPALLHVAIHQNRVCSVFLSDRRPHHPPDLSYCCIFLSLPTLQTVGRTSASTAGLTKRVLHLSTQQQPQRRLSAELGCTHQPAVGVLELQRHHSAYLVPL